MAITRRNFLQVAGAAGALGALAACNNTAEETPAADDGSSTAEPAATDEPAADEPADEPAADGSGHDLSEYPLDPDGADVEAKYETVEGALYTLYNNDGGTQIGLADTSKLIQVDGYAFRDLNGNGKLDIYEDWRLDVDTRAEDLANQMDIHYALRQMNSGGWLSESQLEEFGITVGEDPDPDLAEYVSWANRIQIDEGYTNRIQMQFGSDVSGYNKGYNLMQGYAEGSNFGIPVLLECETMMCPGPSWPSNPTLAASFKMENALFCGRGHSAILRGCFGATKANSPQSDIGTEPTWDRNSGTFCGDPALGRDMADGYISGSQSTWSDDGSEDLGWGKESMCCNMKHYPGDGAAQYGRNSHGWDGAYDVYPNDNFKANWVPFIDGALHLTSKTEQTASFMPFYSIAYSEDEEFGPIMGGGYSKYLMDIAKAYGYKGMYSSDWGIVTDRPWGAWDLDRATRQAKIFEAGMCLLVDDNEYAYVDEAYDIMVEDMGQDEADAEIRDKIVRIHRATFNMGMFDNPYIDKDRAKEIYDDEQWATEAKRVNLEGIVMLKNAGGVIKEGGIGKGAKVYVPAGSSTSFTFFGDDGSDEDDGGLKLIFSNDLLTDYDVVTDPVDEDGNATGEEVTADDLKDVEFAIIKVNGPNQPNFTEMMSVHEQDEDGNTTFYPRTLQYRTFTADDASGCAKESIAGCAFQDIEKESSFNKTENWSPYGQSVTASNESELDKVIAIKEKLPADAKVILCVSASQPCMCFHELEPYGDVIFWAQQNYDDYFMDLINGDFEPFGLLPWNLPLDMTAVYTQATDTPRDEDCYVDSEGNTYEFAFGMNWDGVIDDDRVAKYKVDPILAPESEIVEEGLI